ncbi:MAG: glycine--tRNA ligase [bacterium]
MDKMEKIISLCKRRGFVYPSSEIYGGLANAYDYGPLGTELKRNIKREWWKYFIQDREDMVGIDGNIILNPKIWEVSGHIKNFKDPLVECKKCHHRFRPDKLEDVSKCPDCGGEFTEQKMFSGMFKTTIGAVEEEGLTVYLRPETAQAIFANFKNILDSNNKKIPFGIGQIGKAFRNEITAGQFIFRTFEFEQMEIEYFIRPESDWNKAFEEWLKYIYGFAKKIGLDKKNFFDHEIKVEELAHYSKRTIDIEYQFPFGQDELWAIAYRGDYDLSNHKLDYFDDNPSADGKKRYTPHVIEPTFGVDRTLLALLTKAYTEEELENGEIRTVLKFKPNMAPYKAAVFPLLKNKPELIKKAREVFDLLKIDWHIEFDDNGNIGKRYRRQDEIGTPYCITIDFDSLEKDDVTIRDRDTMKQERIKIKELRKYLKDKLTV